MTPSPPARPPPPFQKPRNDETDLMLRPSMIKSLMGYYVSVRKGCMRLSKDSSSKIMASINDHNTLVYRDGKQLGAGVFGVTFATTTGPERIPSVMKLASEDNAEEARIGLYLAAAVLNDVCPNIVCTVGYFKCANPLIRNIVVPSTLKVLYRSNHFITVMEKVNAGTAYDLFLKRPDIRLLLTFIMQALMAVRLLHSSGISHSDNHMNNYLANKVYPGAGCWFYAINGKRYFVPNLGYQFMLADFGWSMAYRVAPIDAGGGHMYGGARQDIWFIFRDIYKPFAGSPHAPFVAKLQAHMEDFCALMRGGGRFSDTYYIDNAISEFEEFCFSETGASFAEPSGPVLNAAPYTCQSKRPFEFKAAR